MIFNITSDVWNLTRKTMNPGACQAGSRGWKSRKLGWASVKPMARRQIPNSVIWYSLPESARKFELFCMNITKKKKWKQLTLSLVFCRICHIKCCRLYTILSVTSTLTLVLALASLSPASLLSFPLSPLIRGDAKGVEPGLHMVFISLRKTLWKSWSAVVRGQEMGASDGKHRYL